MGKFMPIRGTHVLSLPEFSRYNNSRLINICHVTDLIMTRHLPANEFQYKLALLSNLVNYFSLVLHQWLRNDNRYPWISNPAIRYPSLVIYVGNLSWRGSTRDFNFSGIRLTIWIKFDIIDRGYVRMYIDCCEKVAGLLFLTIHIKASNL